jgi:hypothetical protein
MLKNLMCTVFGGVLAIGCLSASSAPAQEAVMDEFYGQGVHNFYDRDFFQAMNNLSVAIDGGSRDPRAYYYRGLTKLRSGDTRGAHEDLQMGSLLESSDVDQFYPVSRSLERVQGSDRATLERYRALARAQSRQRQLRRDAVRYEQRRRSEAQVLRSVPVGPAPAPLGVAPATAVEPAGAPPAAVPGPPAPMPPDAPMDDPFAAPATPADAPAADDPFAAPEATPADAPPADAPAETPPAEEDPFAPAPAAEAPAAEAPATPEAPAAEEDPFADDPN